MFLAVLVAVVAAVTQHSYATSAQSAAIGAMYSDPAHPPVVIRINVVGSYAAVLTSGGRIEGELVNQAILVRRFSFGWQAIEVLSLRCRLESHRLGSSVNHALMSGMPKTQDDRPCKNALTDSGPQSDVEAVRQMIRGPLVPYVVVAGDWAMGGWYGAGGGESLYRKRNGRWQLVEGGGGAMGVDYMRRFGVPQSDWCKFGIFDAKCPPSAP